MRNGIAGTRVEVPEGGLTSWAAALSPMLGARDIKFGFYIANSSSDAKLTLVALDPRDASPLAYVKVAAPVAHSAIRNEANWLSVMGSEPVMAGRVPSSLGLLEVGDALGVVTLPAGFAPGPMRWGRHHVEFQSYLIEVTGRPGSLGRSALVTGAAAELREAGESLGPAWRKRLEAAIDVLVERHGDMETSLVLAHRDLTPWNTGVARQGLFVFDWEAARDGYPVWVDELHFGFATGALLGNTTRMMSWSLSAPAGLTPGEGAVARLAYLTDLALGYLRREGLVVDTATSRFLRTVGEALDELLDRLAAVRV